MILILFLHRNPDFRIFLLKQDQVSLFFCNKTSRLHPLVIHHLLLLHFGTLENSSVIRVSKKNLVLNSSYFFCLPFCLLRTGISTLVRTIRHFLARETPHQHSNTSVFFTDWVHPILPLATNEGWTRKEDVKGLQLLQQSGVCGGVEGTRNISPTIFVEK